MFGSHATLVVGMASAIFGLCLGEKLSNMSLTNYKDVKFENCKNSKASSKVGLVKVYPCKHTPCVPHLEDTLSLHIEFIPSEDVRHMHVKLEIGGKHHPMVYPYFKRWVEVPFANKNGQDVSADICQSHIANSSCPLKAGAPISITWPLHGILKPSVDHMLTLGMVQFRVSFLHNNGKPILCFKMLVLM